ncbi:hypothetical protein DAPPUDRAFT_237455 [Daphnia pulex]|uniref:Uncharacterized protein n=1 Tax=Daphnia pulex TaxID=6669 RepID=E9G3X5_DAPPU|nr:hypothetical protein DAPPUDRAFT_237455 [Daphnia pulex]|eukprot:EFX85912.1 hypothetical protein DAPPUDRAFT_237455 [Daphnia pulex]
MWSNAVGYCEFHFYDFVIMNLARSLFVESCGPGTDILEPTLAFVHDHCSAPSLSSRPSASSLRTQKYNLSYFTDELEHFNGRFRAAVTHLQSLTTAQYYIEF